MNYYSFNKKNSSWEMDRRGQSWYPWIAFTHRALPLPAFPDTGGVCVSSLFKWLLQKVPGLKQCTQAVLAEAGPEGPEASCLASMTPKLANLKCLPESPGPTGHNLKPCHRPKGLRDVGISNISVSSGRANLAKTSPVTPGNWRQYGHTKSALPPAPASDPRNNC